MCGAYGISPGIGVILEDETRIILDGERESVRVAMPPLLHFVDGIGISFEEKGDGQVIPPGSARTGLW